MYLIFIQNLAWLSASFFVLIFGDELAGGGGGEVGIFIADRPRMILLVIEVKERIRLRFTSLLALSFRVLLLLIHFQIFYQFKFLYKSQAFVSHGVLGFWGFGVLLIFKR